MAKMLEQIRVGGKMVMSPRGIVPLGASDEVYEEFLENLKILDKKSPVGQIIRMGLAMSTDPRFTNFLNLIASERMKYMSLAAAAKMCEIGLVEFQAFWKDARVNQAINKAIDNLPSLTQDMIDDAKTDESTCSMCDGTGQVEREGKPSKICPNCGGKGVVRTIGDKHARNKLLDMSGAIKKEAPVQVNLNMRGVGMEAAAARLNKAVPFDLDITTQSADNKSVPDTGEDSNLE